MKPIKIPTFQPRLKVLSREQALAIHTAALEILEKTGFKMEHPGALKMLADAGCKVSKGDSVKLPPYLVEAALKSAPRQIDLYDQKGNKTIFCAVYQARVKKHSGVSFCNHCPRLIPQVGSARDGNHPQPPPLL